MARLFLLFTLVPMVELYLLIRIGERVGFLPT
ncbi:MAG: membrane protein FxsA, partial [Polyangiaceae bacterium]|nr:membrane protein FxsA [Polyangiaceae bacterium]